MTYDIRPLTAVTQALSRIRIFFLVFLQFLILGLKLGFQSSNISLWDRYLACRLHKICALPSELNLAQQFLSKFLFQAIILTIMIINEPTIMLLPKQLLHNVISHIDVIGTSVEVSQKNTTPLLHLYNEVQILNIELHHSHYLMQQDVIIQCTCISHWNKRVHQQMISFLSTSHINLNYHLSLQVIIPSSFRSVILSEIISEILI